VTVTLTGVVKRYRGTTALDGVDLSLSPGVTGLLGPNGAGKTTLLRILATVLPPDAGSVRLLGREPTTPENLAEIRRRLGYLPQEMGFPRGFTAFGFVDYLAVLKEWTDRARRHDEVRRVLDLVDLGDVATKRVRTLSGGQRRRVGLAQALLGEPELLLLDEPTTGVDPQQRVSLRQVLSRAGERSTVLLSTHQTEDVAALCDRVVVLDRGRVRFDGSVRALGRDRRRAGVAGGRAASSGARVVADRHRQAPQRRRRGATGRRAGRADPGGRVPAAAGRAGAGERGGGMTLVVTAPERSTTLRALALREARRYARHPLFLLGAAAMVWSVFRFLPRLDSTAEDAQLAPAIFLGLLGVFVGHGLTRSLSPARDALDAAPADGVLRTAALCLACLVPGAVAAVWVAITFVAMALRPVTASPAISAAEMAAMVAASVPYAVGGPLVGVLVARWTRFPGAGLLAAVALVAWTLLGTYGLAMPASRLANLVSLNPPFAIWTSADGPNEPWWVAGGSPGWYLAYITVLCGLAATAAMLHEAVGARRARLLRVLVVLAVVALACLGLAAAADPTRVPL
jgi:ABC-2 type transport system ATP-binding protein